MAVNKICLVIKYLYSNILFKIAVGPGFLYGIEKVISDLFKT